MNNITFDLETLGNTTQAPIVQIGAVKFTDDGEIIDEFMRRVKLQSLEEYDFVIDYDTLNWWFNRSHAAIGSVFGDGAEKFPLRQCLYEFTQWIGKASQYEYWSHATFDPPILTNNMAQAGVHNPIHYRQFKDIRTLTYFAGEIHVEREGVHHDALDDCRYQAKYISKGIGQV